MIDQPILDQPVYGDVIAKEMSLASHHYNVFQLLGTSRDLVIVGVDIDCPYEFGGLKRIDDHLEQWPVPKRPEVLSGDTSRVALEWYECGYTVAQERTEFSVAVTVVSV